MRLRLLKMPVNQHYGPKYDKFATVMAANELSCHFHFFEINVKLIYKEFELICSIFQF